MTERHNAGRMTRVSQESPTSDGSSRGRDASNGGARYFVQSLERGLAVIKAFGPDTPELTLTEVAQRTDLTRAAARRFVLTLQDLGYVSTDGRHFQLTPRVLELGYSYLSSLSLPTVAKPHLEKLVAKVEESSELATLDGEEIVYIVIVTGPRILTKALNVGARMPAHATSMGRVLLAGLDDEQLEAYLANARLPGFLPKTITDPARLRRELQRVRTHGYAVIEEELEEGLRAIAVPIRDRSGRTIAAVNISTHIVRRTIESLTDDVLPLLRQTADDIERELHAAARVHH
jgi:IclR family transcriptional regulator, pca regulon regulatory protein